MAAPLIAALISGVTTVFNRLVPDKNEQRRFENEITSVLTQAVIENSNKQIEVNREEAKHPNLFVAGWRPFVGWMCAIALMIGFISKVILPTFVAFLVFFPEVDRTNINEFMRLIKEIDMEIYVSLLFSLLGLGFMRSYDKKQGTDTKKLGWWK